MKKITEPFCTLCVTKKIGTFKHMFWECPPVMDFWKQIACNLSRLLEVSVPCLLDTLILNNFLHVNLKVGKIRVLLAGITTAKKMVATRWKPPHNLSVHAWSLMFLDIVYLELSIARVHRAKSDTIEVWQTFISSLQQFCNT